MIWFNKGDRVRVKKSAWIHQGSTGTVQETSGSATLVAIDGPNGGSWWCTPDEIKKIEVDKPAGPTWFSKGDKVRIKVGPHSGSLGTVRDFVGGDVWVTVDDDGNEGWLHKVTEIEGVEKAMHTDSIHVDNIVNHPPHYTGFSNGAEVIDITENLPFNRGNAIKYLARAGKKNPDRELEDLKKALWYVAREVERIEKSEKKEEK